MIRMWTASALRCTRNLAGLKVRPSPSAAAVRLHTAEAVANLGHHVRELSLFFCPCGGHAAQRQANPAGVVLIRAARQLGSVSCCPKSWPAARPGGVAVPRPLIILLFSWRPAS